MQEIDKTYKPDLTDFSQCYGCVNFISGQKCRAYETIPDEIFINIHDHREPYKGDGGITYYPVSYEQELINDRRWTMIDKEHRKELYNLIEKAKMKYWGRNSE